MTDFPETLRSWVSLPDKGRTPTSLVVLLHGLGANGQDLLGLSGIWRDFLPETVFVAPDAPYPCDMAPVGYQWFSLQDWTYESILSGVKKAAPLVETFIQAQCKKYGIPSSRTALVGFSQGTMMSLYVGPRYKEKLAGVLGYSGALIGAEDFSTSNETTIHRIPVCLIHGTADEVLPVSAYTQARQILMAAGFQVSGHTTPGLGHGIDEAGVETGMDFLKTVLSD